MNKEEMLEKFKKIQKECNDLIDYLEQSNVPNKEVDDILFRYKKDLKQNAWWLDACGYCKTILNRGVDFNEMDINPFMYYPSRTYAKMAQSIKIFHDMLLAFKWCKDRDYMPNWNNSHEYKYSIVYDNDQNRYRYKLHQAYDNHTVYFSSEEIAKECTCWLNENYQTIMDRVNNEI